MYFLIFVPELLDNGRLRKGTLVVLVGFPYILLAFEAVRRLRGKVVAFRRQNRVRQLKDTRPIGLSYLYVSAHSLGR